MDYRSVAIRKKCLGCAGSTKEVTLCHILDCPLWPYRTGSGLESVKYRERMSLAKAKYKKEIEELRNMEVDIDLMFKGIE